MPSDFYAVTTARFFLGVVHGYVHLTLIVHASEVMTKRLRGQGAGQVHIISIFGMMLSVGAITRLQQDGYTDGMTITLGLIGILFGLIGLIFIPFYTKDSPVSFIRKKHFEKAISMMCQLRREPVETQSIRNEFDDLKTMLDEDEQKTSGIFEDGNMRPLMKITLLRIGSVLAFNYALNLIRLYDLTTFAHQDGANFTSYWLMQIRMASATASLLTVGSLGRKPLFFVSFGGSGLLLIAMGITTEFYKRSAMGALQIFFELVGGFGIGLIADVYSSEAFNTVKKTKSICFTLGIEYALQALFAVFAFSVKSNEAFSAVFMIACGISLLAITLSLYKLPETAKMTLRQSRNAFLGITNND